jgi:hypothetical protein
MKRQKTTNNDTSSTLDQFIESFTSIKKIKMETAIQSHANNKKLELEILQATQISQVWIIKFSFGV